MSATKTWTIVKNTSSSVVTVGNNILVGDIVRLRTFNNNFQYIMANRIRYEQTPPNSTCDFKIYAVDDNENIITSGTFKNGMRFGLEHTGSSFLSVNTDGSITTKPCSNQFVVFCPDILEGDPIKEGMNIQIYVSIKQGHSKNGCVLACSNRELKAIPDIDDLYINVNFPFLLMTVKHHKRLFMENKKLLRYGYTAPDDHLQFVRYFAPPGYAMLGDTLHKNCCDTMDNFSDSDITLVFCKIENPWNSSYPFCRPVLYFDTLPALGLLDWAIKLPYGQGDTHTTQFGIAWDGSTYDNITNKRLYGKDTLDYNDINFITQLRGRHVGEDYFCVGTTIGWRDTGSISTTISQLPDKDKPIWAINKRFIEKVPGQALEDTWKSNKDVSAGTIIERTKQKQLYFQYYTLPSLDFNKDDTSEYGYSLKKLSNGTQGTGRLYVRNYGQGPGWDNIYAWSTTSIIDQRRATSKVKWVWLHPNSGSYVERSSGDEWRGQRQVTCNEAYLLRPFNNLITLYKINKQGNKEDTSLLGPWESLDYGYITDSSNISNIDRELCSLDSTDNKYGDYFFPTFCSDTVCTSQDITSGPLSVNCKNMFTQFCNKSYTGADNKPFYYNYYKYPELCACYTSEFPFAGPLCDSLATEYNIENSTAARNGAGIGVTATTCNRPCKFNKICKSGTYVKPNSTGEPILPVTNDSTAKLVRSETVSPDCSTTLCITQSYVDMNGQLNSLNINQNCNLPGAVRVATSCISSNEASKCTGDDCKITAVFSPATGYKSTTDTITYYKTITDPLDGLCGPIGMKLDAVTLNKTPVISRRAGKASVTYTVPSGTRSPFNNDVIDALPLLVGEHKFIDRPDKVTAINDIINNRVILEAEYKDCIVDWQSSPNPASPVCKLDSNTKKWVEQQTYNKIISQPYNGGTSCSDTINNNPVPRGCTLPKDCVVTFNREQPCTNESSLNLYYDIQSYNSGTGMACNNTKLLASTPGSRFTETELNKSAEVTLLPDSNQVRVSFDCPTCNIESVEDNSPGYTGFCYIAGYTGANVPIYKVDKIWTTLPDKNIGCTDEQKRQIGTRYTEQCTDTCTFDTTPSVSCNRKGDKTTIYKVKTPGVSVSCNDSYKLFLKNLGYSVATINNAEFRSNSIVVKESCPAFQNCMLEKESETDCSNNSKDITYKIIQLPQQDGAKCIDVLKKLHPNSKITEQKNKFVVNQECPPETKSSNNKLFYIIGGIIAVAVVIGIVYFVFVVPSVPVISTEVTEVTVIPKRSKKKNIKV